MSTVKVVSIQHPSAATAGLTLDASGAVTGSAPWGGRNLLYNGAMQVAQRSSSVASITSANYYTADRWRVGPSSLGTWTSSIENDAPTGSGLRKSLKMLCTTANASPNAGAANDITQIIEGQDLQRLAKGTASAQQVTLSFWVKANVTGTYVVEMNDNNNTRSVSASYTVSASATWEKKTITFPADTTGAFTNDNNAALYLGWWLGAGTTFTSGSLQTAWGSATNANRAVGQVNLASATNNYWQVTGVQLEAGPAATAFEFKPFGQELRECQRYYQISGGFLGIAVNTTNIVVNQTLPATMRIAPATVSLTAASQITDFYIADYTQSSANIAFSASGSRTTASSVQFLLQNFTGLTTGRAYGDNPNSTSGRVALSAEL